MHWETKKFMWLTLLWYVLYCGGLELNLLYTQGLSVSLCKVVKCKCGKRQMFLRKLKWMLCSDPNKCEPQNTKDINNLLNWTRHLLKKENESLKMKEFTLKFVLQRSIISHFPLNKQKLEIMMWLMWKRLRKINQHICPCTVDVWI